MIPKPAVNANQLHKSYGFKRAVRNVDLTVPAGTLYGFLGPNGAGKTATIKMLTGLLRPTGGTVHVAGFDMPPRACNAPGVWHFQGQEVPLSRGEKR